VGTHLPAADQAFQLDGPGEIPYDGKLILTSRPPPGRGDTLTGYDSTDGTTWTEIGTTQLTGLPVTVSVGLFVTSPVTFQDSSSGTPTQATASFDQVSITRDGDGDGASASATGTSTGTGTGTGTGTWQGYAIGYGSKSFYPTLGTGGYHRSGATFTVSGSGDIAPGVGAGRLGTDTDTAGSILLFGLIVGLLVMIVVATLFITTEYRRGLIRTTFAATPNRRRVLAAKAVVIGAVSFVTSGVSVLIAVPLGEHLLNSNGNYVFPATTLIEVRIMAGTAALVALTAVAVLALGTILRKSAGAVTAGIVVFVLPYVIGSSLGGSAEPWLFRLTPAAGFAVLGDLPRAAQVSYPYTLTNGYYPLGPWAGLAVLGAYAAVALGVASFLVRRRDV
jgi:ABC-type transport system involved in multi-copper enzyme maturation permease subunit